MPTLLQAALCALFVADTVLFFQAQVNPGFFRANIPLWFSDQDDGQFTRLVGAFFLLLGIAKLHGALHLHEKGAYRVALWAFIVEVVFHGCEVWRGAMTVQDTAVIFGACAVMITWMTLQYKSNLYGTDASKRV